MKINTSPVLTSKNYGINSVDVENNVFDRQRKEFSNQKNINEKNIKFPKASFCEESLREIKNANIRQSYTFDKNNSQNIDFLFDEKNDYLVDNLNILTKKDVSQNLVISYLSSTKAYHNGYIFVSLEENASLNLIININLVDDSENFLHIESDLKANSNLNLIVVDACGKSSICKIEQNLNGENSHGQINTLCLGKDSKIDLNLIQNVSSKNSICTIESIEALCGKSTKSFKGTINFEKGSAKSKGNENEYCLLLSNDSISKSMPVLLSHEEDVDGSHSSATGKINEKQKFYLMSRGLDEQTSILLLAKAKFKNILNKIFDETLKEKIDKNIDRIIKDERI